MIKHSKGITLVALVVTVVILLILAGVAIGTLGGKNGLIMRAQQAKAETRYKEAKEKINIELMEIQAECTEQRKEYNIKEIALKMKESEDITINKTYNKEVASISEEIQIDEENVEAIVVSVDKYAEYKFLIGESTKIEGVLETEEVDTVAKLDFINIETFEKNLLKSMEKQSSIEFSYQVKEIIQYKAKVSIHIQDKENGIARIEFPDGTIECFGRKEYAKDNCEVEVETEYKIKITSKNGETKEETIYIEPEIEIKITEPYIGTSSTELDSSKSEEDNSKTRGTTLYINFSATLVGTNCTITLKEDESKTVPYAITNNGKYVFIVSGTYNGKLISKEKEVFVNKYKTATDIVKYDAGDWTENEIKELKQNGVYDINIEKIAYKSLRLKFGGFTYNGDTDNLSYINSGAIITSRNQSAIGIDGQPLYDGWKILKKSITILSDGTERTYVTQLVHAGTPECFAFYSNADYPVPEACKLFNGNGRNWTMYVDDEQSELIKGVHILQYLESKEDIGVRYWYNGGLSYSNNHLMMRPMNNNDSWYSSHGYLGIRPVIDLEDGVYIVSGNGTESDPYTLGKDVSE